MDKPKKAYYDNPTTKAKLVQLRDGRRPTLSALEVSFKFKGRYVEIINDYILPGHPPGRRLVVRTEEGAIFQDKPAAFTILEGTEE